MIKTSIMENVTVASTVLNYLCILPVLISIILWWTAFSEKEAIAQSLPKVIHNKSLPKVTLYWLYSGRVAKMFMWCFWRRVGVKTWYWWLSLSIDSCDWAVIIIKSTPECTQCFFIFAILMKNLKSVHHHRTNRNHNFCFTVYRGDSLYLTVLSQFWQLPFFQPLETWGSTKTLSSPLPSSTMLA